MYSNRRVLYEALEANRESKVLVYVTGTRPNRETQIHSEVLDFFSDHLDAIGPCPKITLVLHSNGGVTLAGWSIVNLIRMFCDKLEVIIPFKALSTGTLIAIGADNLIMTKQATLGPIDPSTNSPYNPQFPVEGSGNTLPVSVEHVAGFLDLAKENAKNGVDLNLAFLKLCEKINPLALGNVFRTRNQIKMLAERLLHHHMDDDTAINNIISFLCSDSGSHDYTINRREAKERLGLPVVKPDHKLYEIIHSIYKDFSDEMKFTSTYTPAAELLGRDKVEYEHCRGLIESLLGGSDRFLTKGRITKTLAPQQIGATVQNVEAFIDQISEEGWYHDPQ